jgi:hypothetical protein
MAESTTIPMAKPATASKNPDGTWFVRVQHHVSGDISLVTFPNLYFAETMAHSYAAFLNGLSTLKEATKVVAASSDVRESIDSAKKEGAEFVAAGKKEADRLIALALAEGASALQAARAEADKIVKAANAAVAELKKPRTPVSPPVAPKTENQADEG